MLQVRANYRGPVHLPFLSLSPAEDPQEETFHRSSGFDLTTNVNETHRALTLSVLVGQTRGRRINPRSFRRRPDVSSLFRVNRPFSRLCLPVRQSHVFTPSFFSFGGSIDAVGGGLERRVRRRDRLAEYRHFTFFSRAISFLLFLYCFPLPTRQTQFPTLREATRRARTFPPCVARSSFSEDNSARERERERACNSVANQWRYRRTVSARRIETWPITIKRRRRQSDARPPTARRFVLRSPPISPARRYFQRVAGL